MDVEDESDEGWGLYRQSAVNSEGSIDGADIASSKYLWWLIVILAVLAVLRSAWRLVRSRIRKAQEEPYVTNVQERLPTPSPQP